MKELLKRLKIVAPYAGRGLAGSNRVGPWYKVAPRGA